MCHTTNVAGRRDIPVSRGGIEHRAARVSFVTGLSTLIAIVFQLVSVPICLKYWGKEAYGSWLALYAACMLVRSFDTGFVTYVGNELNYLFHQDQDKMREHLASSIAGIAVIGILQLCIGVAAFFFDRVFLALGISSIYGVGHRTGLALLILVGTWALTGPFMGVLSRLLIPAGLMYQSAWFSMGFQISQFAGIILAARLNFDLLHTSLLFASIQLAIHVVTAVYIRHKLPGYYPWWRGARLRTGFSDLAASLLLTVSGLIQQASTNGLVVLVSVLSGPASVPVFTTVRTLANLWTNITYVLTTPLLPEIVRYHAKGEGQKLLVINEAYWVLVGTLVNLGVLISYPFIAPLYGRWTADAMVLDKLLLCLFLASIIVANVGGLISVYLNGINRLGVVLATSIARGLLSLGAGAVLFLHFGLAGFGLGILGGELVALFVMGRYFVMQALPQHGIALPIRSVAPIAISSGAVVGFLLFEGFGSVMAPQVYFAALFGVAVAAFLGWDAMMPDVKLRLMRLCGDRLLGSGAA